MPIFFGQSELDTVYRYLEQIIYNKKTEMLWFKNLLIFPALGLARDPTTSKIKATLVEILSYKVIVSK